MSMALLDGFPLLSALVWLPLLGAIVLYAIPGGDSPEGQLRSRGLALGFTVMTLILSLLALSRFSSNQPGYQLVESFRWIEALGVRYELGIDGVSLALILLTTILMPLIVLSSHSIHESVRGYLACMLVLETAMLGTRVHACSDVPDYWHLGGQAPSLREYEIRPLYRGRKRSHVRSDSLYVLDGV
jgi:NADH-quinone oxidoreductase subunit M